MHENDNWHVIIVYDGNLYTALRASMAYAVVTAVNTTTVIFLRCCVRVATPIFAHELVSQITIYAGIFERKLFAS